MLSRLGNVEAMHAELKKAKNEQALIASQGTGCASSAWACEHA
jgi:hypothetical protein